VSAPPQVREGTKQGSWATVIITVNTLNPGIGNSTSILRKKTLHFAILFHE
jgi:hypothetical protein